MAGWTAPEFVLPQTRAFAAAAVWGNWLVVAGGSVEVTDPVTTYRKDVVAARIGPNGSLGPWKTIAVLPGGRVGCALWISPVGKMYIFGGAPLEADPTAAMIDSGRDVLVGQLNSDGDLQGLGLVSERTMPHSLVNVGVAPSRDFLYMVGGLNRRMSLTFKDQTGNMTLGDTVTGVTSGATAVLHSQTDSGATGTLNLSTVVGTFVNDEVVKDQHYGSVVINGTLGATVFLDYDAQAVNFVVTDVVVGRTSGGTGVIGADADGGVSGTLTLTTPTGTFANNEKLAVRMAKADGALSTNYFLDYDAQGSYEFAATDRLHGVTSGATAVVNADTPVGAAGALELTSVSGVFQDNEKIAVKLGRATGALSASFYLDYDAQTRDFVVNDVLHGITSGAIAIVDSDADGGAAGSLTVSSVVGTWANNEKISVQMADSDGGLSTNFYLDYDTQTGNFTVGQVVTGAGGAFGTIAVDTDNGATGTLELTGITGVFVAGETITDPITGAAKVAAGTVMYKTLAYDDQRKAFAPADPIQSLISGGTGVVMSDTDNGVTGILKVKTIVGTFPNNERIVILQADVDGTQYKTLGFDEQGTSNFVPTQVVKGLTALATATIQGQTDAGASGTLKLTGITGAFSNDEWIGVEYADVDGILYKNLLFKDQTKDFIVAQTIRGASSLASGVIQGQTDGGATGSLKVKSISGVFTDNEYLLVDHADVNGTQFKALGYDGQTGNFSVGDTVTGVTSSTKLTIVSHTDSGATGVMASDSVVGGPFVADESIQGALAGGAVVNAPSMTSVLNSTVYRARVFADGSLGVWESIGVLPAAVSVGPVSIVAQGENLYWQSGAVLYWAKATGERLDSWQSTSAAADLARSGIAAIGDKLLALGGDNAGEVASVYVMPVDRQGPNGVWSQTAALPVALQNFGLAVQGDRLWVCGGISTTAQSGVVSAQLSPDGRINGEKNPI